MDKFSAHNLHANYGQPFGFESYQQTQPMENSSSFPQAFFLLIFSKKPKTNPPPILRTFVLSPTGSGFAEGNHLEVVLCFYGLTAGTAEPPFGLLSDIGFSLTPLFRPWTAWLECSSLGVFFVVLGSVSIFHIPIKMVRNLCQR